MNFNGRELGLIHAPIAARLRSLHEISMELSRTEDESSLVRRAVELCIERLDIDRVAFWFVDPADPGWKLGSWGTDEEGNPRDESAHRIPRSSENQREQLYRGDIPFVIVPGAAVLNDRGDPVGRSDFALAPLWDGTSVAGELVADNLLTGRPMIEEDGEVLAILARTVAHLSALKRSEAALKEALAEKAVLLDELQHRTKNSFAMMKSLISLEADRVGESAVVDALKKLRDRVSVLTSLYGQLDVSAEFESVRLDEYLQGIATDLLDGYGADARGVSLECRLDQVRIDMKRAVPVGLVVNELITDSLKHAFPDGRRGTISLSLALEGAAVRLAVSDDGVGLPPGFAVDSSTGFGINLVDMLCGQLGAALEVGTAPRGGAAFTIAFSL